MAGPLALRLTLLGTAPSAGRLFRLHKRLTTIGRSAENDIVLADLKVHPSHAYVQLDGGECTAVAEIGRAHV